jgi:hypothetical protein
LHQSSPKTHAAGWTLAATGNRGKITVADAGAGECWRNTEAERGFDITGLYPVSRDSSLRLIEFDCVMINRAAA